MDKLYLDNGSDTKKLIGAGRLSIQDAAELKDLLMEAYNSPENLLIDLAGVESLDLACIQVLCSANITYKKAGKHMRISGVLPEGVKRSLKDIAIEPEVCDLESPAQCLWATGGGDE